MHYFDYPKVKHSLGQAALQDPYPAWILDSQGVIHAANLMTFWLWDTINPGEPIAGKNYSRSVRGAKYDRK